MNEFIVKTLISKDLEKELEFIGFDDSYRKKAVDKYTYRNLKIYGLTLPQANILKQTALSLGADCALHRDVLISDVESSDVILGGSHSQIRKICEKLKFQPFSMSDLAKNILYQLENEHRKTKLVGILNVTPNSFSDGGLYNNPKSAIKYFYQLVEDGADIIDIGAESTKPYAEDVPSDIQIERLRPIIKELKNLTIPISVDTRSSQVARFVLENGVSIINDVSGLNYDPKMIDIVAEYKAALVIQHSTVRTEDKPCYKNLIDDIYVDLLNKSNYAREKGVNNIIIDVGIGFGKSKDENFTLIDRIEEFYSLKLPVMIGISRKSLLGVDNDDNVLKDSLSLALSYPLIRKNVDYLRVHNVKLHKQLLDLAI